MRLCDFSLTQAQVWTVYEKLMNDERNTDDYVSLATQFFESADFVILSAETQKDYRKYAKKVLPVFGKMNPDNIKPEYIRKYLDKRGVKSKNTN